VEKEHYLVGRQGLAAGGGALGRRGWQAAKRAGPLINKQKLRAAAATPPNEIVTRRRRLASINRPLP